MYLRYSYLHGARLTDRTLHRRLTTRQEAEVCNTSTDCYPSGVQSAPSSLIECIRKLIFTAVKRLLYLNQSLRARSSVFEDPSFTRMELNMVCIRASKDKLNCQTTDEHFGTSHVGHLAKYRQENGQVCGPRDEYILSLVKMHGIVG